ncbi:MAG: thioredoxin domain-containing protein [bacterium]|nr:thioredoxin domain-containing protein [bacterium]MDA1292721.1 thioredoxin domain-containing protein [bacterium]
MADSSNNQWFGISMVLVGVIVGYGVATSSGGAPIPANAPTAAVAPSAAPSAPAPAPTADDVKPVDLKRDHIRGNRKANIALIEYSDAECPFCGRHHPTAQALIDANDDVMWVYRHFPLGFHQNATPLAEASECAWEQGGDDAFWAFTDMIFEKGADASRIAEYGDASGVDGQKVQDCVDAGTYAQYVQDDMAGGSAGGVSGTPGNIVLNIKTGETRLVSGAQPLASFQAAVDAIK